MTALFPSSPQQYGTAPHSSRSQSEGTRCPSSTMPSDTVSAAQPSIMEEQWDARARGDTSSRVSASPRIRVSLPPYNLIMIFKIGLCTTLVTSRITINESLSMVSTGQTMGVQMTVPATYNNNGGTRDIAQNIKS